MAVEETGDIRRAGRGQFAPGSSGNPRGRPAGSRNRTTQLCADLLAADAEEVIGKCIRLAKKGDGVALKLVIERLLPVRAARDRHVELTLPASETADDLVHAAAVVIDRAAAGEISLSEAKEFMALLEGQRKAIETAELAVRLELLEARASGGAVAPVDPDMAARVRRLIEERLP